MEEVRPQMIKKMIKKKLQTHQSLTTHLQPHKDILLYGHIMPSSSKHMKVSTISIYKITI
jgi:hypothetical protein